MESEIKIQDSKAQTREMRMSWKEMEIQNPGLRDECNVSGMIIIDPGTEAIKYGQE